MTQAERRLAIVAAALAGERAGALLARVAGPGGAEAVSLAQRLAGRPRAERLRALAAELAADPVTLREQAAALALEERGAVARLLASLPAGTVHGRGGALVARLCRERLGS